MENTGGNDQGEKKLLDTQMIPEIGNLGGVTEMSDEARLKAKAVLDEKAKWENVQNKVGENLEAAKAGVEEKTAEKTEEETKLANLNEQIKSLNAEVGALRDQSKEMGYQLQSKKTQQRLTEGVLDGLDAKIAETVKDIEDSREGALEEIIKEVHAGYGEAYREYAEKNAPLAAMLEEQKATFEAGKAIVGEVTEDEAGKLTASSPENLELLYGKDSEEVKRAMEVAIGGDKAADITQEMVEKIVAEYGTKTAEINRVAEEKEDALDDSILDQVEKAKKEGEEEKVRLQTERDAMTPAIEGLEAQKSQIDAQLQEKSRALEALFQEKEKMVGKVEGLKTTIESFEKTIEKNSDFLARTIEQMGSISERGVNAVRALGEAEQIIANRMTDVELKASQCLADIERQVIDKKREVKDQEDREYDKVDGEYNRRVSDLETKMGLVRDENGDIVLKAKSLEAIYRSQDMMANLRPEFEKVEKEKWDGREEATNKKFNTLDEIDMEAELAKQKIEKSLAGARADLIQAASTAKFVRDTAVDVFGTGPLTPETTVKQTNFFTRAKNMIAGMFRRG